MARLDGRRHVADALRGEQVTAGVLTRCQNDRDVAWQQELDTETWVCTQGFLIHERTPLGYMLSTTEGIDEK
jgi:hypothetical protein